MVERAGFTQVPPTPHNVSGQPNQLEVGPDGQQTAQPARGATVGSGVWGQPPGLTPASGTPQAVQPSAKQEVANAAEAAAQQALLALKMARDALAATNPHDKAAQRHVAELKDRAVQAALFNAECQSRASGTSVLVFYQSSRNRYEDSSGLARATKLLDRALGSPVGRAYDAQEQLSDANGQLEDAKRKLAELRKLPGHEREKADAQLELVRCRQARATAAHDNVLAWQIARDNELWGRKSNHEFLQLPHMRELSAGLAKAEELEITGNK